VAIAAFNAMISKSARFGCIGNAGAGAVQAALRAVFVPRTM
jgi:hypothetical protein